MKKGLFALFLAIALLLSGCADILIMANEGMTDTTNQAESASEEVIFDNDNVKVTYISIDDTHSQDVGYSYLNLRIENKTDKEIWVTMSYCSADKETIPFIIQGATYIYIKSGEIYPATFGLQVFNLSIDNLKSANEITFTLRAVEKDNITNVVFEETMAIEFNK